MNIRAINHVQLAFPARLGAQVLHFYGSLLGLTQLLYPAGPTLRFMVGGQRVDLVPIQNDATSPPAAHLALEVDDLPQLRHRLQRHSLTLDESRPLPGYRRFYVKDPADNWLEFLELDTSEPTKS
ncbi:MAG: VOC family protein [Pseudomonadota bacterium]